MVPQVDSAAESDQCAKHGRMMSAMVEGTYDYRVNYRHQLRRYLKWEYKKWISRADVIEKHPTWCSRVPKN